MAEPKACQTPSAAVAPSSSIPAKAPQLGTPFKAERCPREPGSSCGPWVGPLTAPPAAPYTGWRDPLKGWKEGAGSWQQPPAKGTRRLGVGLSRGTQRAEWQRCHGTQGWLRFSTSRLSCLRAGSCSQGPTPWLGSAVGAPAHCRILGRSSALLGGSAAGSCDYGIRGISDFLG